jgi:anthranilate 1,2-dioxygenase small subunit
MSAPRLRIAEDLRRTVEALHTRYVRVIDEDRLEEWPDLFTETCTYRIVTRENLEQNLPLAIMECRSRGMLRDRVTGYRKINVYEPQRYLHQTSALEIEPVDDTTVKCRSNYLVIRTVGDGTMTIFSAGMYLDTIVLENGGARFQERIVVQDSRRVETLLVIPL